MKNKESAKIALLVAVFLLASFGTRVLAVEIELDNDASVEVGSSKSEASMNATATANMNDRDDDNDTDDDTFLNIEVEIESEHAQGDAHKSDVAIIVDSLLSIANRDGGIGEDIRLVAQEQASTSIKVKEDMDSLESESKVKIFFFGPDYRSLGDLRSAIVTTQNNIERLKKSRKSTTYEDVKVELDVEISALEDVASSTQVFVDEHADKLSLLGWFVHIFVR